MSVNTKHIVTSDKFKYIDDGFKYFISYQEDEIVKPRYIILPQMSRSIKYFENGRKSTYFMVKDDSGLNKYNEIWGKIKEKLNIQFHSIPVYDQAYIKGKVREFEGVVKANILGDKIPKENTNHAHIACITIDFVMKIEKKNYLQVYLEECKYKVKKIQMSWFINAELDSDSESKFDTELKSESEVESDTE